MVRTARIRIQNQRRLGRKGGAGSVKSDAMKHTAELMHRQLSGSRRRICWGGSGGGISRPRPVPIIFDALWCPLMYSSRDWNNSQVPHAFSLRRRKTERSDPSKHARNDIYLEWLNEPDMLRVSSRVPGHFIKLNDNTQPDSLCYGQVLCWRA